MSSIPSTEIKSKIPERSISTRDRAYLLQFRFVNKFGIEQGKVQEKVFWFAGSLRDAKNRSRLHCERMGYRYVYCHAFIVDLDSQEELKNRSEEEYNKEFED